MRWGSGLWRAIYSVHRNSIIISLLSRQYYSLGARRSRACFCSHDSWLTHDVLCHPLQCPRQVNVSKCECSFRPGTAIAEKEGRATVTGKNGCSAERWWRWCRCQNDEKSVRALFLFVHMKCEFFCYTDLNLPVYDSPILLKVRSISKMGRWTATTGNKAAVVRVGTCRPFQAFSNFYSRRFQLLLLLRTTSRSLTFFAWEEGWESNCGRWPMLAVLYVRDSSIDCRSERHGWFFHCIQRFSVGKSMMCTSSVFLF